MGKIVFLMGKSSTGKDTLFKELMKDKELQLKNIISYTTRPIRDGEKDGVEYFFKSIPEFEDLKEQNKVIEYREYNTIHGLWIYFTANDGQICLDKSNYIIIGTLESYISTCKYFGEDKIIPVMIELDDGIRLKRALERECQQDNPKYEEMCRRFLADSKDFSEEKILEAKINRRFYNDDLNRCKEEIKTYIIEEL